MGAVFKYAPPTGFLPWDGTQSLALSPKSGNVVISTRISTNDTSTAQATAPNVPFAGIPGFAGGNVASSVTSHTSGKYYAEFLVINGIFGPDNQGIGFYSTTPWNLPGGGAIGGQNFQYYLGAWGQNSVGIYGSPFMGPSSITVSSAFYGFGVALNGTTFGLAIDLSNQLFWWRFDYDAVNHLPSGGPNFWEGSSAFAIGPPTDPATGTNGVNYSTAIMAGAPVFLAVDTGTNTQAWSVNFGPPPPPPPPPPAPPIPVPSGTKRYWFEVQTPELEPADGLGNAWFVDAGITPVFATLSGNGIDLIGLWPFNNMTVDVWMAGLDWGQGVVVQGKLHVPFDSPGATPAPYRLMPLTLNTLETLSTPITAASNQSVPTDFATPYIQAVVGFAHNSRGQRLRDIEPQSTASGSMVGPALGKTRRVHMASFLFDGIVSGTVSIGTSFTTMYPIITTDLNMTALDATQLYSGVWFDVINGESDQDGMLAWSISRPYPLEIMAVESHLMTQER